MIRWHSQSTWSIHILKRWGKKKPKTENRNPTPVTKIHSTWNLDFILIVLENQVNKDGRDAMLQRHKTINIESTATVWFSFLLYKTNTASMASYISRCDVQGLCVKLEWVVLQFSRQILHLEDEELHDIHFHQTLFVLMFSCNSPKLTLDDPLQWIPVIYGKLS